MAFDRAAFEELLCDLFDVQGLRRWLCLGPDGDSIADQLLESPVALVDFVHAATGLLLRRGMLDAGFQRRLIAEFPRRRRDILTISLAEPSIHDNIRQHGPSHAPTVQTAGNDRFGLVGTLVGEKYRIECVVGEGGSGIVYRARHQIWDRLFAVKCFIALANAPLEQRQALLEQFIREGQLLERLSTRTTGIVQAHDIDELTTPTGLWLPYMVLEWLDGKPLDAWLGSDAGRSRGPERDALATYQLMDGTARALSLAHADGVAHRDIKPANFFVVGPELVPGVLIKVLDFGIAKEMAESSGTALQATGAYFSSFTACYGAPEQFGRRPGTTGPWTDVFQMALVLVEIMRGGLAALDGDSYEQLEAASQDRKRRPTPRTHGVVTSNAVEAVFQRALAVKVGDRYQDMAEFWAAFGAAVNAGIEAPTRDLVIQSWRPAWGWMRVAVAVVVVGLGGVAGWKRWGGAGLGGGGAERVDLGDEDSGAESTKTVVPVHEAVGGTEADGHVTDMVGKGDHTTGTAEPGPMGEVLDATGGWVGPLPPPAPGGKGKDSKKGLIPPKKPQTPVKEMSSGNVYTINSPLKLNKGLFSSCNNAGATGYVSFEVCMNPTGRIDHFKVKSVGAGIDRVCLNKMIGEWLPTRRYDPGDDGCSTFRAEVSAP